LEESGRQLTNEQIDLIRKIKEQIKNLGEKGLPLLERELIFFKNKQANFITLKEYEQLNKL
jgi:hypothetical protein